MAKEQLFTGRAEHYAAGRPGYARGVFDLLFGDILKEGDVIADVGSGTGIFARAMMERGFDVYCVEPNGEMRAQAEKCLAGNPHFRAVAATAEATTLPSCSVNLITAASAFHWFDADLFSKEAKRILKPGGIFFAVINARDYGNPFTVRQHEICVKLCEGFTSLRHGLEESVPKLEKLFGSGMNHAEFDFPLEYTKEKFIRRSLSSSYAPKPGTAACERYRAALQMLLDEFFPESDRLVLPNVSVAYWGGLS